MVCAVLTALATGCVTAPIPRAIVNSRTIQKPYDAVWERIIRVFTEGNVQMKQVAKDSGLIQAEIFQFNDRAADCGSSGLMRVVGRRTDIHVTVVRSGPYPEVTLNLVYTERRYLGGPVDVRCQSRGEFEAELLDAIAK